MSFTNVVTHQFRLILLKNCRTNNQQSNNINDLMNTHCMFHLFTAILGYALILTVAIGHVSLLYKVLRSPDGGQAGYSRAGIAAWAITSSNFVAYALHRNFPFSTWGEGVISLAYYVIIINLILLYNGRHRYAVLFMCLYVPVMVILLWPFVPGYVLVGLKIVNIPIDSARMGHQIYQCYKAKGQTQFSSKTVVTLANVYSSGRLLTSLVDTGDLLMIISSLLEWIFSLILMFQAVRYYVKRRKNRASPSG